MSTMPQAVSAPLAPVTEARRLKLIDALRGVALLGILLMNIPGFSMAQFATEAFRNDPSSVNFWVLAIITIFFEGKMRALFGMIFGAGVILFITKKEETGQPVTLLFYRRMFWLIVFGLVHAHLILWIGDILYLYGICGMIVFLFRKVKPIYLVLGVPLVAIIGFVTGTLFYQQIREQRIAYVDARAAQDAKRPLSEKQQAALKEWSEVEHTLIPNRELAKENTQKMKSDYSTVAAYLRPKAFLFQTKFLVFEVWDSLALMLLGIALFRWGFLSGQWSREQYWRVLWLGYGLGLPLVTYSYYHHVVHNPTLEAMLSRMEAVPIEWIDLIYPFQRILLVLAHASAIILLYQANVLPRLFRSLVAVGQMAFTNYIMHSVICTLFFFGYGLNYFAELELYQVYFLALAIWVLQLIISPLWLQLYLFGPLEWLWRSLTYWKVQPMRRVAESTGPSV
jgi:uncharacterized protein